MDKFIINIIGDIDVAMKIEAVFEKAALEVNVDIDDFSGEVIYVYKIIVENETVETFNETLKNNGLEEYCCQKQSEPEFAELPF